MSYNLSQKNGKRFCSWAIYSYHKVVVVCSTVITALKWGEIKIKLSLVQCKSNLKGNTRKDRKEQAFCTLYLQVTLGITHLKTYLVNVVIIARNHPFFYISRLSNSRNKCELEKNHWRLWFKQKWTPTTSRKAGGWPCPFLTTPDLVFLSSFRFFEFSA